MLILCADNLSLLPGVAHGFFGRTGGVSSGLYELLNCGPGSSDDRANVIENRKRVAAALGAASLVTLGQIHGAKALTVSKPWPIGETRDDDVKFIPLGDAMVTATAGIALGILTADCAPILLADAKAGVIGAAHAGWKGALAGVIESALAAMETLGASRRNVGAAIGPCIGQMNYEVGADFHDRFLAADARNTIYFVPGARPNHHQFDLEAYVADRLHQAGVDKVERLSACTYARDADFFSFRRTTHRGEKDYGREISAIVLR